MKPNPTSVLQYLPQGTRFNKYDLSECSFILRNKMDVKRKLDREQDSKLIAHIFLQLQKEKKEKAKQDKITYKKVSKLYRICIPYKVDCYNACCRFMEYKYSEFVHTPDRIPKQEEESKGCWYNHIMKSTGYYKESCGAITERLKIDNFQWHIFKNCFEEFKDFIIKNNKVLKKHYKDIWQDYSHLAYNNISDDF